MLLDYHGTLSYQMSTTHYYGTMRTSVRPTYSQEKNRVAFAKLGTKRNLFRLNTTVVLPDTCKIEVENTLHSALGCVLLGTRIALTSSTHFKIHRFVFDVWGPAENTQKERLASVKSQLV